ncbi:hypothetical protein D3C83_218300 [compost metagenome]
MRTRFAWICGMSAAWLEISNSSSPEASAVTASEMPLYGTWVIWMPAAEANSEPAKWLLPPDPDDP